MFDTEGSKYHPLFEHLLFLGHGQVTMSFADISAVVGAPLPPSAFAREEWWSNSPNGHSQARAWMRAGYNTSRVDLAARKVTFTLEGWPEGYGRANLFDRSVQAGLGEPPQADLQSAGPQPDHPLFGIWLCSEAVRVHRVLHFAVGGIEFVAVQRIRLRQTEQLEVGLGEIHVRGQGAGFRDQGASSLRVSKAARPKAAQKTLTPAP